MGHIIPKVREARLRYQVRIGRSVSIQEVADHLGVSRVYLSNIEHGKAWPTQAVMEGLCELYGVNVGELFVYVREPAPSLDAH